MTTSTSEQQARLDGQLAAVRGHPFTDNPHPLGTIHSRSWSKGHSEIANARAVRKGRA